MQNKLEQVEVLLIISDFSLTEEGVGDSSVSTLYEPRLIDKCLEEISWLLSPNVIVAYGNNPKSVGEELLRKWSKRFKRLQYLSVDECKSINDILRQVEDRQLLKTDFLFVYNCATFCSVNLESWIENFRTLRKQNKNAVATLIYSEIDVDESSNNSLICYRTCTKKLVNYNLIEGSKGRRYLQTKKDIFLIETTFRTDLFPLNIFICALDFIGHFAGNYDFNCVDNIILDILSNEEVIGQEIYLNILEKNKIENLEEFEKIIKIKNSGKKKIKEFPGNCSDISDEEENEEGEEENIKSVGEGNNKQEFTQFILEVRESMQELFEKERNTSKSINESEFSNLKLEISSCKLAYNVPMDELPRLIFLSFIGIPGVTQQLVLFKKSFDQWMILWNFYFKKLTTRIGILHALEDFSTENENFCRILPNILHWLNQEKEFLEDEQIILWYSSLNEESPLRLLPKLGELVEWLKEEEGRRNKYINKLKLFGCFY
uniref:W2 domain-containing protein n=1 Tax=Meloidogyne enterolobii TaxID=390850 RepID=A0A6V7VHX4_MELEN|nr:unnamed protein product [Meloidogyne enterolobii]